MMVHKVTLIVLILLILVIAYVAGAEDEIKYILCNPKVENHVAIRNKPKKDAEETGRLDCGDEIYTDGKTRNGFLHILGYTEAGDGWVHLGYVVEEKPVIEKCNGTIAANGRVMSWRRITGGKNCWLNICDQVKIYARTDEWAVTNKGYIRMKYLEIWYE